MDRGKLLDALHKAASAALSTLKLDSTLGTIEHTVGIALRKVVQKYSNRRPDVIIIATEGSLFDRAESVKSKEGRNRRNENEAPKKNAVNSIDDEYSGNEMAAIHPVDSAPSRAAVSMAGS